MTRKEIKRFIYLAWIDLSLILVYIISRKKDQVRLNAKPKLNDMYFISFITHFQSNVVKSTKAWKNNYYHQFVAHHYHDHHYDDEKFPVELKLLIIIITQKKHTPTHTWKRIFCFVSFQFILWMNFFFLSFILPLWL